MEIFVSPRRTGLVQIAYAGAGHFWAVAARLRGLSREEAQPRRIVFGYPYADI